MRRLFVFAIALYSILLVSCKNNGVIQGVDTFLETPQKRMTLEKDSSFVCDLPDILYCQNLQIVEDSILVIQSLPQEGKSTLFDAYSIPGFQHLGSFVTQGRGPDEIPAPEIVGSDTKQNLLYIRDNATGDAYIIDVHKGIHTHEDDYIQNVHLPDNVVDWAPINRSTYLSLVHEGEELTLRMHSHETYIFHPYAGINAHNYMTKLSTKITGNEASGKFALAMVCFPQIAIVDSKSHALRSIAVDPSYRNWESILNRPFGPETIQYYRKIISSDRYIIALYDGCSLSDLIHSDSGHRPALHVFDWNGNFLYDFQIKTGIEAMCYEPLSSCLYCIESTSGQLIRYDLSILDSILF